MHANIPPSKTKQHVEGKKTHGTATTASVESVSINISLQRKHRVDIMVFLDHQQAIF